jgi:hypothetical protein
MVLGAAGATSVPSADYHVASAKRPAMPSCVLCVPSVPSGAAHNNWQDEEEAGEEACVFLLPVSKPWQTSARTAAAAHLRFPRRSAEVAARAKGGHPTNPGRPECAAHYARHRREHLGVSQIVPSLALENNLRFFISRPFSGSSGDIAS